MPRAVATALLTISSIACKQLWHASDDSESAFTNIYNINALYMPLSIPRCSPCHMQIGHERSLTSIMAAASLEQLIRVVGVTLQGHSPETK